MSSTYDTRSIVFHWLTAALVLTLWLVAQSIDFVPRGDPRMVLRSGELPSDYAAQVHAPFVENLSAEINRALQFFFANTAFRKIDALMLAGGSASLSGLQASIEKITHCPCFLANPFDGMLMSESVRLRNLKLQAPAFLTACGLALRRFSQ